MLTNIIGNFEEVTLMKSLTVDIKWSISSNG